MNRHLKLLDRRLLPIHRDLLCYAHAHSYTIAMSLALVLMVVMTMGAQAYPITQDDKPSFCNHLDCPLFQVIENEDVYQLREYEATLWAQTGVQDRDYKTATTENYRRLRNYISGANEDGRKIDMAVPVIKKIITGQGHAFENNFTTSFYLTQNASLFNTFPSPTDNDVTLARTPKLRVFVRSFPGYVTAYDTYRDEAEKMIDAIDNSTRYIIDYLYTAHYNSPFQLNQRHNEVWLVADE